MARDQLAVDRKVGPRQKVIAKAVNDNLRLHRGAPEGREQAQIVKSEPAENFLALYFRQMAPLPVLQPEEEFEAARNIETLETTLWAHIFSHPEAMDFVLDTLERAMENSLRDFPSVRRRARALVGKGSLLTRRNYQETCERLAKQIHALDVDRGLLFTVVEELRALARGERGRAVKVKSRTFRAYSGRVRGLFGAAQRARNEFVKSNLRLVVSIARRFNHGRMPLSDLIQEGNIGLIKAVERYDYRRGYRFSTYASWWIRHAISRALADKARAVRLPVHMLDAYQKVARTTRDLVSRLGRNPTVEEISASANLPKEKVEKIQGCLLDQSLSLDRAVSDEDDRHFVELLTDPEALVPTEKIAEQSVTEHVQGMLGELKPIEADVLRKRFGLDGVEEQTLKEIGDSYKLSRERIRQIQEQALGKIRRALQRIDAI